MHPSLVAKNPILKNLNPTPKANISIKFLDNPKRLQRHFKNRSSKAFFLIKIKLSIKQQNKYKIIDNKHPGIK